MSYTLMINVPIKNGDDSKLDQAVLDFNQEARDETGETEMNFVEVDSKDGTSYQLSGDPHDLGAFMIRLYTQDVWQGGLNNELPLWDGTYDPNRENSVEKN